LWKEGKKNPNRSKEEGRCVAKKKRTASSSMERGDKIRKGGVNPIRRSEWVPTNPGNASSGLTASAGKGGKCLCQRREGFSKKRRSTLGDLNSSAWKTKNKLGEKKEKGTRPGRNNGAEVGRARAVERLRNKGKKGEKRVGKRQNRDERKGRNGRWRKRGTQRRNPNR